ncbi:MAG: hypothetical protein LBQ43_03470, partial [Holosporales bacterium]|nr:hypothetical protein [Holosporales bacterium]
MYKLSFPKICLMLVCLSSTFFGTTEERFQDIRNKVDRSFNNDAIECVDGFSSSGYPVEVIARDLIEELGDSYATMLVLMKCLDTQVFATPEKKENIRKVAMYIMLTSDPATINPITPGLENINTFVAKLFPESGIANNFDNYLKYLEFEMLDPSQISREELRQPGDEDQIKNAVEQRICGIKFRNMILGPKNRALSQLRISDEEINKIKEDERELFYRRKTSNAHEKMVKDAIANRKRCGGPIKDYDQFERSALLIVKAFSKAFSDSYALDNDVRTVNEQIQRAEELPDVGAIQINDEKTALACAPVIRLANLFFDAEYCNRFLDEIGPNASYGIAHYLKKEYLRDLLTKDRETLEVVTPASRSRVIFPLRLDLCGNYHTSYSSDVWMVINPASYNYCWKAHVSAYPSSASRILGVVSGCFKTGDPTFKLNPTNWRMRNLCLESLYPSHVSGKSDPLGITQFGKWLTYYPR